MGEVTDWAALWCALSTAQRQWQQERRAPGEDAWREQARRYQAKAHNRWLKPDV